MTSPHFLFAFCLTGALATAACVDPARNPPRDAQDPYASVDPETAAHQAKMASCGTGTIDDLEDADAETTSIAGRGGYWFTSRDESGTTIDPDGSFVPSDPGANGSEFAARISGATGEGEEIYAVLGFTLTKGGPYDASGYRGVSFWAKGNTSVQFGVADIQTDPDGGICKECYNDFAQTISLTSEWKQYIVEFSQLQQDPYWGDQFSELKSDAITKMSWSVDHAGTEYDVWVDDIELVGCQ